MQRGAARRQEVHLAHQALHDPALSPVVELDEAMYEQDLVELIDPDLGAPRVEEEVVVLLQR